MNRLVWIALIAGAMALAFLIAALTIGKNNAEDEMAKAKSATDKLCEQAALAIAAKDWPEAFNVCKKLEAKKGGAALAHAYRGKAYEEQGKLAEADVEYTASLGLDNHVASISVMRVRNKMKAVTK